MKMIIDEILHLYLINPELLDEDIRSEIRERLPHDKELNDRLIECEKFYREYNRIKNVPVTLLPLCFENNDSDFNLAALNGSDLISNFNYLTTFASADNFLLVRVHYRAADKEYKLFFIADDMDKVKNRTFRISGYESDFFTDHNGTVIIKNLIIDSSTRIEFIP